jgi:hypothetical protein
MPWFKGTDINLAIEKFWQYIFSDDFKADLQTLHPSLKVRLTGILVSGASAGAWLAMYSFLRSQTTNFPTIDISIVYLQYPMLRHYKREKAEDSEWNYMGHSLEKKVHIEYAKNLEEKWKTWRAALDKAGITAFDVDIKRPWAPLGMSASFLASSFTGSHYNGLWEHMYREGGSNDAEDYMNSNDINELLYKAKKKPLSRITDFYAYHGTEDTNCPTSDTLGMVQRLKEKFGVKKANLHYQEIEGETHGFDHDMGIKDNSFLTVLYKCIGANLFPENGAK